MQNERIFSVAFDGIHRAGKGTQIEILKTKLEEMGIPCISVRGEGYRSGSGDSFNNPKSNFWSEISDRIKKGDENKELWDEASYRLAREFVIWKYRVLSSEVEKTLAPFGVLLVDRSLISKSVLKSIQSESGRLPNDKVLSNEEIYPSNIQKNKKITVDMVLPDIIFELVAPKEILLKRLNNHDSDYNFRKNNIENSYDIYVEAKEHLPEEIRSRIVTIDSSIEPNEISEQVLKEIKNKLPEISDINN